MTASDMTVDFQLGTDNQASGFCLQRGGNTYEVTRQEQDIADGKSMTKAATRP